MEKLGGGRKPNGECTNDDHEYFDAWDEYNKPFEKFGFRITAFDPCFQLCDAKTGKDEFVLPVYAARRFLGLDK